MKQNRVFKLISFFFAVTCFSASALAENELELEQGFYSTASSRYCAYRVIGIEPDTRFLVLEAAPPSQTVDCAHSGKLVYLRKSSVSETNWIQWRGDHWDDDCFIKVISRTSFIYRCLVNSQWRVNSYSMRK